MRYEFHPQALDKYREASLFCSAVIPKTAIIVGNTGRRGRLRSQHRVS